MNPNESLTPGEELEIRITALLMGELSSEESTVLRAQLAESTELQSIHTRLARAYELLRAAATLCETADPAAPAGDDVMCFDVPGGIPHQRARLEAVFEPARMLDGWTCQLLGTLHQIHAS